MELEILLHSYLGSSDKCFTFVGVLFFACITFKVISSILQGIWLYFLSSMFGNSFNFNSVGSWAVVTGATDGIGKAYAEQLYHVKYPATLTEKGRERPVKQFNHLSASLKLASRGLNIVLISRSLPRLQQFAKDLESRFKVHTKVVVADFIQTDIYETIGQELSGLDIGTLVNNVGISYEYPEYFDQYEDREKFIMDIINCNSLSVAMMTSLVLPSMVGKRKGVIINISSVAGTHILPLLTMYSATKAFVDFFSRCLHEEYKSKGIVIQVVSPGFVVTKINKLKPNILAPLPETFVRSALKTVGRTSRTYGYWRHALFDNVQPSKVGWMVLGYIREMRKPKHGKKEGVE